MQQKQQVHHPKDLSPEEAVLGYLQSNPGMPLESEARSAFEPLFAHDFSKVRVHADERAASLAEGLQANAFAVGNNIVFNQGMYRPGSPGGQALLSHELTHTVQQGDVDLRGLQRLEVSGQHSPAERQARTVSAGALFGSSVAVQGGEPAAIAREDKEGSNWQGTFDNPIWNWVTNNMVSGGVSLLENADETHTLPMLTRGLGALTKGFGGMMSKVTDNPWLNLNRFPGTDYPGMRVGFAMEDALNAPSKFLPGLLRPLESLGNQSRLTAALGPLGMISNGLGMRDTVNDIRENGLNAVNSVDMLGNTAGMGASTIATTGLAGAGLNMAGLTGAGETMLGTARFAGPAGAVLGSFAGGVALGRGANNVAAENDYFGQNRSISDWGADVANDIRESGHPYLGAAAIPFLSLGGTAYTGARWAGGKVADGAQWAGGKVADGAQWVGSKAKGAYNYISDNVTLDPDEIDWGRTFSPWDW